MDTSFSILNGYRAEYATQTAEYVSKGCIAVDGEIVTHAPKGDIVNDLLYVANDYLHVKAGNRHIHRSGACVASRFVTLVATCAIELGSSAPEAAEMKPVRLYAQKNLTMAARHIILGNVHFVVEPENASLACQYLTIDTSVEGHVEVEVVKSWLTMETVVTILTADGAGPGFLCTEV